MKDRVNHDDIIPLSVAGSGDLDTVFQPCEGTGLESVLQNPSQARVPPLTCPIGEEPDCKDITARLQYVKVGSCKSEEEVDIHYCQVRAPDFAEAYMGRGVSLFGRYLFSYISEGS